MGFPINSSIQTGLPNKPQTSDPEMFTQMSKVYAAIHRMIQEETNNTRQIAVFTVNVAAGQLVTLTNVAGVLTAGLANATTGSKLAYGFANNSVLAGGSSEVQSSGLNQFCTGLTIAGTCYLDITDGGITQTKPSATGNAVQIVGHAISATTMFYNGTLNHAQL